MTDDGVKKPDTRVSGYPKMFSVVPGLLEIFFSEFCSV
jgi:hypothetical protein